MANNFAGGNLHCLSLREWQEYVESHPESTPFHHHRWIGLLMGQYGYPLLILAIKKAGEIVAALPFLETRKPWGMKKLVSLPFTDCINVLARDQQSRELMGEALRAELLDRYRAVILRTDHPISKETSPSDRVRHQILTLRPHEECCKDYAHSLRTNLRRAQECGLRFERATDASALDAFYRLHLATRRRHGVPIQPRGYFARLYECLLRCGLGYVGIATKANTVVAAGVFLTYNKTTIYKYSASDIHSLDCRPNEFLAHSAIRLAAEEGYESFDFGMSARRDQGLCRFKRKWGATETDLYHEYLCGTPPTSVQESLVERVMAQVVRHSPTFVCRVLGEVLYRYSQ